MNPVKHTVAWLEAHASAAQKLLVWAHLCAAVALPALCVFAAWQVYQIRVGMRTTQASAIAGGQAAAKVMLADNKHLVAMMDQASAHVNASVAQLGAAAASSARLLTDLDLSVRAAQAEGKRQAQFLDEIEPKVLVSVNNLNGLLAAAKSSISGLQPVEVQATALIANTNKVVSDPRIFALIDSAAKTAKEAAGVTGDMHKVTTHLEREIDAPRPHHWWTPIRTGWTILWQASSIAHDL